MTEAPRVDIIIKTDVGGKWIIEQAEEIAKRGNAVRVVLPNGSRGPLGAELERRGIETVDSPFDFRFRPRIKTLADLRRLRGIFKERQTEVLMYHLYASALAARISTIALPTRRIQMVAGPLFLESRLIRLVERLLSRLDDVIISGCANAAQRYNKLGYPSERLPVVSYGVDTDHYSAVSLERDTIKDHENSSCDELRREVRNSLCVSDSDFLVIMVAYVYGPRGLVHRGQGIKGHHVILEAWKLFVKEHPNARLLLVGGGHNAHGEKHRFHLMEQFGVKNSASVTWVDSVDDVRKYYLAADVSVSPSLSEGHGAVLEASSMALPSIVSDAGGLPETVDGSSGWQVLRGNAPALLTALKEAYTEFRDGRLNQRGRNARKLMIQRFDRSANAAIVADIVDAQASAYRGQNGRDRQVQGKFQQ